MYVDIQQRSRVTLSHRTYLSVSTANTNA